jgi:predicted membrane-bound spermidine synthase
VSGSFTFKSLLGALKVGLIFPLLIVANLGVRKRGKKNPTQEGGQARPSSV